MKFLSKLHLGLFGNITLVLLVLNLIRFSSVNPNDLGPAGLAISYSLLYLFFLSLVLAYRVKKQRQQRLTVALFVSSMVIAFAPLSLLALSSLGQLGVADFILIVVIQALLYFYIRYQFS